MNIAFVSFEYPIETGGGGIGTYLKQMVQNLPLFGHKVVVFCGTFQKTHFWEDENVFRIPCLTMDDFNQNLMPFFTEIHHQMKFDVVEGTDFRAWGLEVKKGFPNIPFVVRAHTANFIVDQYLYQPLNGWNKWKFILGAFRRLQMPKLPSGPLEQNYLFEKEIVASCDALLSPSNALGEKYIKLGWVNKYTLSTFFFKPNEAILRIEPNSDLYFKVVFYGRLEIRKGVLEIAEAIPALVKEYPNLKFYFFGESANSPESGVDMQTYLIKKLKKYRKNVFFEEAFSPESLKNVLELGDIFLFPSRFDSFGLVCCEAMSAGKAVIGSRNGGMAEIIEDGVSGLLVNPNNPSQIVEKVSLLVENPSLRLKLGQKGRERILSSLNIEKITPQQIKIYQDVINRKNGGNN